MFAFLGRHRRRLALGLLLTFASSLGQTFYLGLFGEEARAAFGLSAGQWGTLYSAATLASALALFRLGRLVDHRSVRTAALVALIGLAAAGALFAAAPHWALAALGLFGLRLFGQGMCGHVAMTATARWFDHERGRALSVVGLGMTFGEAILPVLVVAAIAMIGWREASAVGIAVLAFAILPAALALAGDERARPAFDRAEDPRTPSWSLDDVVRDRRIWLMAPGLCAAPAIVTALFFHQSLVTDAKGVDIALHARWFSAYAVIVVVASLGTGALVDRFGARHVLPFALAPFFFGCLALASLEGETAIPLYLALFGFGAGALWVSSGAVWAELYGLGHIGAIRAAVGAVLVFATALGPGLLGVLLDLGVGVETQLLFMALYIGAAVIPLARGCLAPLR